MPFEGKELSPAALLDEKEDRAFHAKCAADLMANEPPKRSPTPAPAPRYVTEAVLDRKLSQLCQGLGKMVKQELDRRMAELEQKQLKLGGVWKAGEHYAENTLVSFQGGLWISRAPTEARPGSGSPAWRLAIKRGDGDVK